MHFARQAQYKRHVRRSGGWFPERGCNLEHQMCRFAKMFLRDDLASLFTGRRNTLERWGGKIAKRIGTRPSALRSTYNFPRKSWSLADLLRFDVVNFRFWRKSRRISSFWSCGLAFFEEVSQNCFVLDLWRKFRIIASFQTDRKIDP